MYRVHGNDGNLYDVPSLAVLQQYVDEHRVVRNTVVDDLLSGDTLTAEGIEGLRWTREFEEPLTANSAVNRDDIALHFLLFKAIVATVFCCSPVAIYSVILAAKVPEILKQGDTERAKATIMKAHLWANIGILTGILWIIFAVKSGLIPLPSP